MNKNLNHWSNYWKGGNLTSLPQDFLENYDGEIAVFWIESFSRLRKQSEVLDLCTGNGAIALLAASYSVKNQLDLKVTAVDAAKVEIDNLAVKYAHLNDIFKTIKLISGCRVEDIDLATNSFDMITSQYGIEYCNWENSATQVYRLLKPGGQFNFISHANSTDIMAYMTIEQDEYERLKKIGFFSVIAKYINKSFSYKDTVRALTKIQKNLLSLNKQKNSSLYVGILNFLQHLLQADKVTISHYESDIRAFYHQHRYAFARLEDVLAVSKNINDNPEWYLNFEKKGLKLQQSGEILQSGIHNAGRFYKFIKPENS